VPPPSTKIFPWRWIAVGSLAAGVVGLIIGIPLIAVDGHPVPSTCAVPDRANTCKEVYNTVGGGATALTLGIVGLALSGPFFYLDHRARKKATMRVGLSPTLEGATFVASGAF
jgi:hypothetical protein